MDFKYQLPKLFSIPNKFKIVYEIMDELIQNAIK